MPFGVDILSLWFLKPPIPICQRPPMLSSSFKQCRQPYSSPFFPIPAIFMCINSVDGKMDVCIVIRNLEGIRGRFESVSRSSCWQQQCGSIDCCGKLQSIPKTHNIEAITFFGVFKNIEIGVREGELNSWVPRWEVLSTCCILMSGRMRWIRSEKVRKRMK